MDKLEIVCFVAGVVLLGVALFGGGLVVMQIKIPKVSRISRIISGCLGPVFILVALFIAGVFTTAKPEVRPEPVNFVVKAALGADEDAGELETEMVISLDGQKVAELSLDSSSGSPAKSSPGTMPQAGVYPYSIVGYTRWTTDPSRKVKIDGGGMIDIQNGRSYTVRLEAAPSSTTQTCIAYLREVY